MPTYEIPVADAIVKHKLATTETADFVNKAGYAHIVLRVIDTVQESNRELGSVDAGTIPQRFHILGEVSIGEGAKFGLSLEDAYVQPTTPEQGCAKVVLVDFVHN